MSSPANAVDQFVADLAEYSTDQANIVQAVREIYQRIEPTIAEKIIYGGVGYFLQGKHIGGVYGNKHHVSIVFSRGSELSDPAGLLEGKGKFRRHIKATSVVDLSSKGVVDFVQQVVQLEGGTSEQFNS